MFALEWITTGFSLALPLDTVALLLDLIVCDEFPDVLIRASIAIVALLADQILTMSKHLLLFLLLYFFHLIDDHCLVIVESSYRYI